VSAGGSKAVVIWALGCNLAISAAKFVAYTMTGSSAMLSEAIHSLVDTSNQALLLHGIQRSKRPADSKHPFGYSQELYFWSFIVAILLFSLGAGVAIYEGVEKILHPHPMENVKVNYIVLVVALALEGGSMWKALEEFNARRGDEGIITALRASKDPALFAIVLEDAAALAGLVVALVGIFIADKFGIAEADGIASIVIGMILAAVAAFVSVEIKSLIVGEAASRDVRSGMLQIIKSEIGPGKPIRALNEMRTMHLGPEDVLVAASVDFNDDETAAEVEATTARLERAIKTKFPEVQRLFIEVQSAQAHAEIARMKLAAAVQHDGASAASETAASSAKSGLAWYETDRSVREQRRVGDGQTASIAGPDAERSKNHTNTR
jgi:cation diffusion facilitator family transporter